MKIVIITIEVPPQSPNNFEERSQLNENSDRINSNPFLQNVDPFENDNNWETVPKSLISDRIPHHDDYNPRDHHTTYFSKDNRKQHIENETVQLPSTSHNDFPNSNKVNSLSMQEILKLANNIKDDTQSHSTSIKMFLKICNIYNLTKPDQKLRLTLFWFDR